MISTSRACTFSSLVSAPKRLELLRAVVPKPKLIGVLVNPKKPNFEVQLNDVGAAAREIRQDLLIVNACAEADLDAAFADFCTASDRWAYRRFRPYVRLSRRSPRGARRAQWIPSIYDKRGMASAGGLMSYGTNFNDSFHQMRIYTGQILKGTKPADLPVVQSTKFELVINLKTATALSLTIPPSIVALADEVIE